MVIGNCLQHIGIMVADCEAAAAYYVGKEGYTRKAKFFSSGSTVVFVLSPCGVLFELIQRPAGSKEAQEIEMNGGKIDHIAFECDDLEVTFENAKKDGLEIIEGIVEIPEFWAKGFRYFLTRSQGKEKIEFCKVNP
ncbi:MAG: VOC family protein [Clostridia bacterium]